MIGEWVWSKQIETGVKEIDNQHIYLLNKINNFNKQISVNVSAIEETIGYLEKYISDHFQIEEWLQRKYKYPDYEHHKKMHKIFIDNIHQLKTQLSSQESSLLLYSDLSQLINEWLVEHIGIEDMKLADYINTID